MIRSELIQIIADENPHLYQRDVERIVNTVFSEITEALAHFLLNREMLEWDETREQVKQ